MIKQDRETIDDFALTLNKEEILTLYKFLEREFIPHETDIQELVKKIASVAKQYELDSTGSKTA